MFISRHLNAAAVLLLTMLPGISVAQVLEKTHIDVTVVNRPDSKKALLYKSNTDPRFNMLAEADIVDGHCSFDYVCDYPCELVIYFDDEMRKGQFLDRKLYAEGYTVRCCFHSDEEAQILDSVESMGELQFARQRVQETIDSITGGLEKKYVAEELALQQTGGHVIEEVRPYYLKMKTARGSELDSLREKLRPILEAHDYDIDSEAEKALYAKRLTLWAKIDTLRKAFIADNASLLGLIMMREELYRENSRRNVDEAMEKLETAFRDKYGIFSGHPYYGECDVMFTSRRLKPGKPYKGNYKIHALDGSQVTVSELIAERPAIIDLWASWCGPCRRHSKELIPIYERYAPKGLAFVAVAREMDNEKAMLAAIGRDGYPWQSYIDLDDADGIWALNGCPNAGGRIFLIDADGIIVAVNPAPEDIEKYLAKHFSEK